MHNTTVILCCSQARLLLMFVACVHIFSMTGVVVSIWHINSSAIHNYIGLMPHKIVLQFESFKTPLQAISRDCFLIAHV